MTIRSSTEAERIAAEAKQMSDAGFAVAVGLATVAGMLGLPIVAKVLAVKAGLILIGGHAYAFWIRYQAKYPETAA